MKTQCKHNLKKILIFFMLLSSFSAVAQQNNEQIPQGKWVFESVTVSKGGVQIPLSTENLGFEIPAEIDVQQDESVFVYDANTMKERSDIVFGDDGKSFCFSVCTEWKVTGNKLQLQVLPDMDEETPTFITLNYDEK